jgi:DNA helicase-2/ATP-dependent DNA helicase PcrA
MNNLTKEELVAMAFFNTLQASGIMTYDMILKYGLELLQLRTPTNINHLLVDEYQDCSEIDHAIYEDLPATNKFRVGDHRQAIFGFRGGNPEHLVMLSGNIHTDTVMLENNYRSSESVCRAANYLIFYGNMPYSKMVSVSGQPGQVKVFSFDDDIIEKQWIASKIIDKSTAILCRTNALVDYFTEAMNSYHIPVASKPKFPENWSIIKAYLELLQNPSNDILAVRYLGMTFHDPKRAQDLLTEAQAEGKALNEKLWNYPPIETIEELRKAFDYKGDYALLIDRIIERFGCETLSDVLMAMEEVELTAPTGDGVTVCTIHQAKGREFDIVFLPAFEQHTIPGNRGDVEESRRLAYVAITRARETVYISHSKQRQTAWGPITAEPSQFIKEVQ